LTLQSWLKFNYVLLFACVQKARGEHLPRVRQLSGSEMTSSPGHNTPVDKVPPVCVLLYLHWDIFWLRDFDGWLDGWKSGTA